MDSQMHITSSLIIDRLHEPEELESLYRQNPNAFRKSVDEAIRKRTPSDQARGGLALY